MPFENYIERLSDTVSFPMVAVKGGSFLIGRGKGHQVSVPDFYVGQFLVTQEVWMEIMGENPSYFQGKDRPVEQVSWNDIVKEFLPRLSERTNKEYRLSSESEWEYTARGGTDSDSFFYSGGKKLKEVGWYRDNSHGETKEVGQKLPNEFGIYDMSGNVDEWCSDYWHNESFKGPPSDGSVWVVGGDVTRRVIRGGAWSNSGGFCRLWIRFWGDVDKRSYSLGFRLSLSKSSLLI